MPKDYFSSENITQMNQIPKGSKVHLIGVCGVAMAPLAVMLADRGFEVSGSDKEFYEPMGSYLQSSKVTLKKGYDAANVPHDAGLVIIGNAISYGHPEVDVIEERQLPYSCFPAMLYDIAIDGKRSIVISGTHGKSTTTALTAFVLESLGEKPSYFFGGVAHDFPQSFVVGEGTMSVVEGDEYDSAFFAKVPKFHFYRPDIWMITSLEFDHADIYSDIDAIRSVFREQASKLPKDAIVIACSDYPELVDEVRMWERDFGTIIHFYGNNEIAHYRLKTATLQGSLQELRFKDLSGDECVFSTSILGDYNALNALGSRIAIAEVCGKDASTAPFQKFRGVKRRQDVLYQDSSTALIEDFAHHPTAVRETVKAVHSRYPDKKLIAVFEPRSNTSRRKIFEEQYQRSFEGAHEVILSKVQARSHIDAGQDLLDVDALAESVARYLEISAYSLDGAENIFDRLVSRDLADTVILVMSNGSFGGLAAKLQSHLKSHSR